MRVPALLVVVMIACLGADALGADALGADASGADKTDVLVLNNGDRITGEILNLSRGRVELKTDHSSTIEVEWDKVVSVESPHRFTITLADGTRLTGTLERPGPAGSVRLGGEGGGRVLAVADITGIEPLGRSFWAKLTGSVGAGFTYTRSSGISQLTFNSDTTYRRPAFLASLNTSATLTSQRDQGDSDDSVATVQFLYQRFRGRRWFIAGLTQVETNRSLGLDLRTQGGGLAGARLVNTNRAQVQIGAGVVGNDERGVEVDSTQNIEGLIALQTSYYTYDRPKTNLDVTVQYYPSLSDWGRQRFQLNSGAKREVWKNFYLGLNLYDTFDSAPPNASAARNDVGITTSISWSFGS